MTKRIEPDLFARLMKLSSGTRSDLLEYIGQTPLDGDTPFALASERVVNSDNAQGCANSKS